MTDFTKADYLNAAAKILDGVPTYGPDGKRREPNCDCCLTEPEQIPVSMRDGKQVCLICLHEPAKHACCQ